MRGERSVQRQEFIQGTVPPSTYAKPAAKPPPLWAQAGQRTRKKRRKFLGLF